MIIILNINLKFNRNLIFILVIHNLKILTSHQSKMDDKMLGL